MIAGFLRNIQIQGVSFNLRQSERSEMRLWWIFMAVNKINVSNHYRLIYFDPVLELWY